MRRKLLAIMLVALSAFVSTGCGSGVNMPKSAYYDQLTEGQDYNHSLFYQNDLTVMSPDPSVIYIQDGSEDDGYYYVYGTSHDDIGSSGYQSWRSKDLSRWESMGVAFQPERDAWARWLYWAPEVVYYRGLYYMFYNAQYAGFDGNRHCIGLATSTSPRGPFKAYSGTNANGDRFDHTTPFIISDRFPEGVAVKGGPLIDASPYINIDEETSKESFYLYFTFDIQGGKTRNSSIWGLEMQNLYTPKYNTIKQLTDFNRKTVGGSTNGEANLGGVSNVTNEAPFMWKQNGKYYLTFSTSQFNVNTYSVCQAVGDSPLGDFTKIDHDKGGLLLTALDVINTDLTYDHMAGTGHHSFIKVGEELFIAYHAFVDRYNGTIADGRALAVDRVFMVNNGEEDILYVSGPSYSLQPLPALTSGYRDLAREANVSATNVSAESSVDYLTQGYFKNHSYDFIKECEFTKSETEITLKFDKEVSVRAIMVYNAFNYENSFEEIERISIMTTENVFANINKLGFDLKKHIWVAHWDSEGWDSINSKDYVYEEGDLVMRPGGSAIAEFNEIKTTEIRLKIKAARKGGLPKNATLNISNITVLGK